MPAPLLRVAALLAALLPAAPAVAEVRAVLIDERGPFAEGQRFGAAGAYERLRGRLVYAVDAADPAAGRIVDFELAPRAADGAVWFAGDFLLLKPVDWRPGTGVLLYDVNNRGSLVALAALHGAGWSNDPRTSADAGDGLLFERGWALLWTGWNWDVLPGDGRLQIDLPVANAAEGPVTGLVAAEIVTDRPARRLPLVWGGSRGYPPAAGAEPSLTVRPGQRAPRQPVPGAGWRLGTTAHGQIFAELDGGFRPGLIYEAVYTARDPRVAGLGLLAIRDALAFFRNAGADREGRPNPLAGGAATALAFGVSQSGRVIQHMLMLGLDRDSAGQPALDGALIHVAGAGKGDFNRRFAQTTRHPSPHEDHGYPVDVPPFTPSDVLAAGGAGGATPKLFYTQTSTEYWTRSASLLHVDAHGQRDLPLDPFARLYVFAGGQHVNLAPARRDHFARCRNPLDHRPGLRALILALADWVREGRSPPESRYPRLAEGALGTYEAYRALVPDAVLPPLMPPRLSDDVPPRLGAPYITVVPLPDGDGIDRGGIRLPLAAVPLGSLWGWNVKPGIGDGPTRLDRWFGSMRPFTAGRIRRRHPDEASYAAAIDGAAARLVTERLLLARDRPAVVAQARALYRALTAEPRAGDCGWLAGG